jgi:hypothetical protein
LIATLNANASFAASSSSTISIAVASSALARTYTSLLPVAEGPGSGTSTLVARVDASGEPVEGEVTFLDSGSIIGTASLDSSGRATLAFANTGGTHILRASFAGNVRLAPSVSPPIEEDGPATAGGFSLTVDGMAVTVVPGAGFHSNVALSCDGVPDAYTCTLTPSSLVRGGTAYLRVTAKPSVPASTGWRSNLARHGMLSLAVCVFFVAASRRRRWLLLMTCACMIVLFGCGTARTVQDPASPAAVVTIRASSMQSNPPIVHSVQVLLRFPSSR